MAPASPEPAIATTKRKFHKLLGDIAASSSTTSLASTLRESNASTASLDDATTPPMKRSRVSDVGAEMEARRTASGDRIKALQEQLMARKTLGRSAIGTVRAVNGKGTAVTPSTPRKTPNFQPYSQEQFLARLKTFADVKKWSSKPDDISEVAWAKRGWVCDVWNTVACRGGCERRVVVRLRPKRKDADGNDIELSEDMSKDIDDGLVDRYVELMVDGHGEDCLWRKRGCEDDIYHIPIPNRAKTSAESLERYHSFRAIAADLPLLENLMYPAPHMSDVLQRIPSSFFNPPGSTMTEPQPTSPSDKAAFTFALFGWTGVSEAKIALATCHHCFQRIGLWLYKDDRLQEMSTKLKVSKESLRLNLLESHREHCPWKNAQTQRNPRDGPIKDMAAWETLEFLLMSRKKLTETPLAVDNTDAGTFRDSVDSYRSERRSADLGDPSRDPDSLNDKWKKFKAKLKRTTSRKSLKSIKSSKSTKSLVEKGKENQSTADS